MINTYNEPNILKCMTISFMCLCVGRSKTMHSFSVNLSFSPFSQKNRIIKSTMKTFKWHRTCIEQTKNTKMCTLFSRSYSTRSKLLRFFVLLSCRSPLFSLCLFSIFFLLCFVPVAYTIKNKLLRQLHSISNWWNTYTPHQEWSR